jgi:hypothetical protein
MSSRRPIDYRDEELGAALRSLDVPEHRPRFDADLRRLVAAERDARRARERRGRPGLRWGLRVAVVAAAVAVIVLAIGLPRSERSPRIAGPEPATAAVIKERVRQALATLRNLRGIVVSDGPQTGDERRWRFVLTDKGDFRLVGLDEQERVAYDASTGVAQRIGTSASLGGKELFYSERRGVAPGPPDLGPPTWILPREFGAFVRALLAARDPRLREIEYEGRPAWQLDVDAVPNAIVPEFSGDRIEITVDRATGVPVRVLEKKNGSFRREIRLEKLRVDTDLGRTRFSIDFPPAAEVMHSDEGFRRVALDKVEGVVGYPPLVPSFVPKGYELAEVAVAEDSFPTGAEAGNPPSKMVVSLSYRRGLDQLLVTTRLADVPSDVDPSLSVEERWSDPLATGEGFVDDRERVGLDAGALRGHDAELVVVPRGIPHLWALAGDLVVTVGGDASRAELLRVAESLARQR